MSKQFDSHMKAAFAENVTFLREDGLSDEAIAKRLGVTLDMLKKYEERKRERDRQTA